MTEKILLGHKVSTLANRCQRADTSFRKWWRKGYTVNSEIFARILFLQIALKYIFVTFKICDKGVIYLYQKKTEWLHQFVRILFSRNFAYANAKFRENKTLAKISKFTVILLALRIWYCILTRGLSLINWLNADHYLHCERMIDTSLAGHTAIYRC